MHKIPFPLVSPWRDRVNANTFVYSLFSSISLTLFAVLYEWCRYFTLFCFYDLLFFLCCIHYYCSNYFLYLAFFSFLCHLPFSYVFFTRCYTCYHSLLTSTVFFLFHCIYFSAYIDSNTIFDVRFKI